MSTIKKTITKSKSHQIKTEKKNLTYSLEKIWDLAPMRQVNRSTRESKRCASSKKTKFKKLFNF